jgi:hypothetical protein
MAIGGCGMVAALVILQNAMLGSAVLLKGMTLTPWLTHTGNKTAFRQITKSFELMQMRVHIL